jgi:hypothetical protein
MKILCAASMALIMLPQANAAPGDRFECRIVTIQDADIGLKENSPVRKMESPTKFTILEHEKEIEMQYRYDFLIKHVYPITGTSDFTTHGQVLRQYGLESIAISHIAHPFAKVYAITKVKQDGWSAVIWLYACEKYSSPPK